MCVFCGFSLFQPSAEQMKVAKEAKKEALEAQESLQFQGCLNK